MLAVETGYGETGTWQVSNSSSRLSGSPKRRKSPNIVYDWKVEVYARVAIWQCRFPTHDAGMCDAQPGSHAADMCAR